MSIIFGAHVCNANLLANYMKQKRENNTVNNGRYALPTSPKDIAHTTNGPITVNYNKAPLPALEKATFLIS